MDSEIEVSSVTSLAISDSASTQSKRGKGAHITWGHTRTALPHEPTVKNGSSILYCAHCPSNSSYSTIVTTNFRKHLQSKHQIIIREDPTQVDSATTQKLQQLYDKAESSGLTDEFDSQIFQKVLNQSAINEALVSLIVVRNLPFRIVEWPEFHVFCRILNPKSEDYFATAHSTIPKLIERT